MSYTRRELRRQCVHKCQMNFSNFVFSCHVLIDFYSRIHIFDFPLCKWVHLSHDDGQSQTYRSRALPSPQFNAHIIQIMNAVSKCNEHKISSHRFNRCISICPQSENTQPWGRVCFTKRTQNALVSKPKIVLQTKNTTEEIHNTKRLRT